MRFAIYELTFTEGSKVTTSASSEAAALDSVFSGYPYQYAPRSAVKSVVEKRVIYDSAMETE